MKIDVHELKNIPSRPVFTSSNWESKKADIKAAYFIKSDWYHVTNWAETEYNDLPNVTMRKCPDHWLFSPSETVRQWRLNHENRTDL